MEYQKFPYFLVKATAIAGTIIATIGGIVAYGVVRTADLDSQTKLIVLNAGIGIVGSGVSIILTGVAAAGAAYQAEVKNEAQSNVIVDNSGGRSEVSSTSENPDVSYEYTPNPLTSIPPTFRETSGTEPSFSKTSVPNKFTNNQSQFPGE